MAPIRSIHTAVLTSAIAAPPEAVALAAQFWSTYQLAPTKGLSARSLQSAELDDDETALDEDEDSTLDEDDDPSLITLDELEDGVLL